MSNLFELDENGYDVQTHAAGPSGQLPLSSDQLRSWPSGHLFGWTQDAGMGWDPSKLGGAEFLILSTQGGIREPDGTPLALGYHTGHWEVGLLMRAAAERVRDLGGVPFAGYCTDPCDGRSQGTTAMFDSLAYRNDAAIVLRRLIRSLPTRRGVIGVATCDKGHPAMMLALAGTKDQPGVLIPGGVTLPPTQGEDAGTVQTIGARFAHGLMTLQEAAEAGCRACATPGGGCQFLGTAATSQVVGEALGLSLPHSALAPSGQAVWLETAKRSAQAVYEMASAGKSLADVLTDAAVRNAMVVHAAFGGSTNLLMHLPAVAHAAGLRRPTVDDWNDVNRQVPRLVSVLPNGPEYHPTIRVFLAGGVPEVMLHLWALNLLDLDVLTATGLKLGDVLAAWETSDRRQRFRELLRERDGVDADDVVFSPDRAKQRGLTSTVCFPVGNLAPEGSVIKATAIDPAVVDDDGVYRKTGPARVFTTEPDAIEAIKNGAVQAGDVLILAARGPMGAGMEETAQLTIALKNLPWGREVALLTDARFSGVSTGACIGHVGPEALAGGPIGKVKDGDLVEIVVDRVNLTGSIHLVGENGENKGKDWGDAELQRRPSRDLKRDKNLPDDTRLWAALQDCGGGTWGGCVYDVDAILEVIEAGKSALREKPSP